MMAWYDAFKPLNINITIQCQPWPESATTAQLDAWGAKIMAQLDDLLADLKSTADATSTEIDNAVQRAVDTATKNTVTINDLNKQIADLEAQIANGKPTQAQTDAIAALKKQVGEMAPKLASIDPNNPATLPPGTSPPPSPDAQSSANQAARPAAQPAAQSTPVSRPAGQPG